MTNVDFFQSELSCRRKHQHFDFLVLIAYELIRLRVVDAEDISAASRVGSISGTLSFRRKFTESYR